MVFIDGLGTNNTAFLADDEENLRKTKLEFVQKLAEFSGDDLQPLYTAPCEVHVTDDHVIYGQFRVSRASTSQDSNFNLAAPTTAANAMRVVRAMQIHKPILLEGSPGVGKTSLVSALAAAVGKSLTRINLSEQTDLIDLFGSDSPVEDGEAGEFRWRDAPFLRAMKRGDWVLLDEMNLASQSVLEGLNACLDHRGEAYIPELDRSFRSHPDFLVFAAQNPQHQGGGRKDGGSTPFPDVCRQRARTGAIRAGVWSQSSNCAVLSDDAGLRAMPGGACAAQQTEPVSR
ncbi:hypothetical protein KL932_004079 [Ogataea haglerorum]|nr:hypothetical protein KL932_004079 [Ogataea haglerorum]